MNNMGQGGASLEMFVRRCPSLLRVYTHRGHTWLLKGKNWENNRLVRAKILTVNIKEQERNRGRKRDRGRGRKRVRGLGQRERKRERERAIGAPNKHSSFTAHPGHSGNVWRPLNGKGSNKKANFFEKRPVYMCVCVCVCPYVCTAVFSAV